MDQRPPEQNDANKDALHTMAKALNEVPQQDLQKALDGHAVKDSQLATDALGEVISHIDLKSIDAIFSEIISAHLKRLGTDPTQSAEVSELQKLLSNIGGLAEAFREQLRKKVSTTNIETDRFTDELEMFKQLNLVSEKKEVIQPH